MAASISETNAPGANEPISFRRNLWERAMDWLFGRDFFISYRWSDGRAYALALAERLKGDRFDCFLDSEGFLRGDNWQRIGDRELRKTSRLVLVGSPDAHQSEPIVRELRVFTATKRRIIAIAFGDSLSAQRFPESKILPHLDEFAIMQMEDVDRLSVGPSKAVLAELRRTFTGETTAKRRLRAIQVTATVLLGLTILATAAAVTAYVQYTLNIKKAALADAQRAAADVDAGNVGSAVAYFARSLHKNPNDSFVATALLRLAIEQPPVAPQLLASGHFVDAKISKDGRVVLLLSEEGNVILLVDTQEIPIPSLKGRKVGCVALSPSGNQAALSAGRDILRIDLGTKKVSSWSAGDQTLTAIAINEDGRIATGGDAGGIMLWDGERPLVFEGFAESVRKLMLLSPPFLLAAADKHDQWRVWRADRTIAWQGSNDPDDGTHFINGVCFGEDGDVWVGTGNEDANAVQPLFTSLEFHGEPSDGQAKPSPEHWDRKKINQLFTPGQGDTCLVWLNTGELILTGKHTAHSLQPGTALCALSSDGSTAITVTDSRQLRRWAGTTLRPLGPATYTSPGIKNIAVNEDGSHVVTISKESAHLYAFRTSGIAKATPGGPSVLQTNLPTTFTKLGEERINCCRSATPRLLRDKNTPDVDGVWILCRPNGQSRVFKHPLTPGEKDRAQEVDDFSNSAITFDLPLRPETLGVISVNGKTIATAAGAQAVSIWDAGTGATRSILRSQALPNDQAYIQQVRLSDDGAMALVGYKTTHAADRELQYFQLFETCGGKALAEPITFYSSETVWDVTTDLQGLLATSGDEISIRSSRNARIVVGPVTLNDKISVARFAAKNQLFIGAARNGRFRVWRTADAMPLCAETTFDFDIHRDRLEFEFMDAYRFSIWVEPALRARNLLRRLAFKIENNNTSRDPPRDYRIFDVGFASDEHDHKKIADLITALYGVTLSEDGNLRYSAPSDNSDLLPRYLQKKGWHDPDFQSVASWLLADRFRGKPSPFAE